MAHRDPSRNWRKVFLSFIVLAVLLAVSTAAVLYEGLRLRSRVDALINNASTSIELAARIGRDVYGTRVLVDLHVFEKEAVGMQRIEARLAELKTDYVDAARAYEQFVAFPGEAEAWRRLQDDVRSLEPPIAHALQLSRDNQDAEARSFLILHEARFSSIDRDLSELVRINRAGANEAFGQAARFQKSAARAYASALALGMLMTILIGVWTTRVVRKREAEVDRYASLLEARNAELDAFAGRVAHDLRGPLSNISTAAYALSQRVLEEEKTIAIVRRGVTRMEALIEDLLTLSRIDAAAKGGICDPAQVAAELHEELRDRLEAEGATLRLALEPAKALCGEGLLRMALANLVDNALKYHRPEAAPEIEIQGARLGQVYELRVCDHGIGMSVDEARQAFDPFFRALRMREKPGTGLGLSIVKRVIEATGGQVCLDSELGRGTSFAISLKVAA